MTIHIICGSKQVLTKGNEQILRMILWLQDLVNKDQSPTNSIRIAYLPRISNQLYENVVAATDIVTMTQIPGSVSSLLEVIPFLMNGAVLCCSGGSKRPDSPNSLYHELDCPYPFGATTSQFKAYQHFITSANRSLRPGCLVGPSL